jgi:DisA bacterial checkpoint controller nucleotide-binding
MNTELYRARMLERIRRRLEPPASPPVARATNSDIRTRLLLQEAVTSFLPDIGIQFGHAEVPAGCYWADGAEILVPVYSGYRGELRSLRLDPHGGGALSPLQDILILELQDVILTCCASLVASGDTLLDLSHGSFARWAMARMAMHVAGRQSWEDPAFWDSYIWPAGIFNTRLLADLERMLSRTYENRAATTSVYLLGRSAADRLRWSNWRMDARDLFSGDKCGLRLSDSVSTSFAFDFVGTEFLGLFDTDDLASKHLRGDTPHFRWRVLADRSIEGSTGGTACVSYAQGRWQLVDYDRVFRSISRVEPTLNGDNRRAWDLCIHQSAKREGCLILIADDSTRLVVDKLCRADELNTAPDRIVAKLGPTPEEPTGHTDSYEIPVKVTLLEQLRGRRIADITLSVASSLARMDGALVLAKDGLVLGFGIILRPPANTDTTDPGARTAAARAASKYGLAIKVSDDGPITAFHGGVQIV